ncbi:hypothetical protein F4X10_17905 [Candidatus Poribacteria bacterium]|nr:hypothetical protein [Candidatus Poribacteria bacterium]
MPLNKTKLSLTDMTPVQFREWLRPIVNEALFADRDELLTLLAQNVDRETLTEGFRAVFEAYSYDLAFDLDVHEACVLTALEAHEEFGHLKQRVVAVQSERKTSATGRIARRLGGIPDMPMPTIRVTALSDDEFRTFAETLVNSELFADRERVVKLMKEPTSVANHLQLQSAFYEFFVCHLELEQFLEAYEYDPDEGLEIHPEVAEELERSIADVKAGGETYSLEEVFAEFEKEG